MSGVWIAAGRVLFTYSSCLDRP